MNCVNRRVCEPANFLPDMTMHPLLLGLSLLTATLFGSCSIGHSAADDVNSSNPTVAAQAQKVQALEQQVQDQGKVTDAEKTELAGLKQQLDGAKENLKGLRTQAKVE